MILPDDLDDLQAAGSLGGLGRDHVILTTGGTGFARATSPLSATQAVIERLAPGLAMQCARQLTGHPARHAFPRNRRHPQAQPDRQPAW
jgi:molybdopterin biosynthesis enzyme MoaB